MSARYPGDTRDALFMDDGPPPHWWNSPDIGIGTFAGAVAAEGVNQIQLRLHANGRGFDDSQAEVEVFVGNPSLVMTPTAGTINLGTELVAKTAFPAGGGAVETQLAWTVTIDPGNPGGIDQPGHRCLIARVYPFTSAKPGDFQVPTDQHEAQRNICIVECAEDGDDAAGAGAGMVGAPGGERRLAPAEDGLWRFMIDTTTPFEERPERVTLRATRPLRLDGATLKAMLPVLRRSGFRGFAVEPPPKFLIELAAGGEPGDVRGAMTTRVSPLDRLAARLPGLVRQPILRLPVFGRRTPRFEVDVKLEPQKMARLALKADLRRTARGQAHVFHVEQIGSNKQVQGGLTLVLLKVD